LDEITRQRAHCTGRGMKFKDYYATLGIARDADLDQIKKAYRKLARHHHPDMSKAPDAEARFKEVAEAYATLKDADKRAAYDALGQRKAGEEFAPPPPWRQEHAAHESGFDEMDLADLFAAMRRGQGQAHAPLPVRGQDHETSARISLLDAHRGASLHLDLADAHGRRTLEVTIPPGVREGQKLRLRGKGGRGRNGGADGDIYLHLTLAPHPLFRPEGHDLHFTLALAPWEAVLGAEIEVPTLEDPVLLTVPPGTRAGGRLRLRGRGMADGRGGRGDLYATVRVEVPATLTERERQLFTELAAASRFDPRAAPPQEPTHVPHV
jgi:curved DNA-binding protein